MTAMTLHDVWPETDRPLTVDDLDRLPDDGNRYELVNGVLAVTPAPLPDHDRVSHRLSVLLDMAAPDGVEVVSPSGLMLALDHLRVPDLAVLGAGWLDERPRNFNARPPLLVVEVASGSTKKLDRTVKKQEYETFRIESYWIVVPDFDHPSITAYELRDGIYEDVAFAAGAEAFRVTRPFPIEIVPQSLVEPGSAWKAGLIRSG